jgi:serine/threonine-protein kinase
MPAPTPELLPGAVFAGYRIQAKLGQGGMGVVFRAVDTTLERPVALKLMRPELAADQDFAARFLREARTAAQVMHPHVIVIHQAGTHAGALFMAFEFVAGGDLAGRIRRDGPMPLGAALRLLAQCADGLQAIHEAGMVHRDIKPQNIFLDDHGRAKLGDLGLARHADGDDRMTMTGVGMGTPAFMSPEQAEGAADLDIRSDIHALGVTLYMMLTGKAPFSGTTPYAITHQIIAGERPNVRDLRPDVPVAVHDVVVQAMARERGKRYATPADLLAALEHLLAGIGVGASSGGWSGLAIPGAKGDTTRPTQDGQFGPGATTAVTAGSNLAVSPTMTAAPKPADPGLAATAILPTHVASGRADHPTVANTAAMPTLGHQVAPARPAAPATPAAARGPRAKRRAEGGPSSLGAVLIGVAVVAVLAIAALAYFVGKRSDEPTPAQTANTPTPAAPTTPAATPTPYSPPPVTPSPAPAPVAITQAPVTTPPTPAPPMPVPAIPQPVPPPAPLAPVPEVPPVAIQPVPAAPPDPAPPVAPPMHPKPKPAPVASAPTPDPAVLPGTTPMAPAPPPVAVTPLPAAIPAAPPAPAKPQTPAEHLDALLASEHFQEALRYASHMGDDDAIAAARQRVLERHDQRKNQIQGKVDNAPTLARARALLQPALETWGLPGDKLWAEATLAAKARDLAGSGP